MAVNQVTTADGVLGQSEMDYPAHLATYEFFTSLIKWGTVFVILAVLLLAFLTL
jgi:hypothetical protein